LAEGGTIGKSRENEIGRAVHEETEPAKGWREESK